MRDVARTIAPDWRAPPQVQAFCTTRLGGFSEPPFDSMNLGLHTGDAPDAVLANRARMRREHALPAEPVWLRQVHGVHVVPAELATDAEPADGAWVSTPDRPIAVMTADCLPVVLCDTRGSRVAVVHAGWRGLAAGVLDAALAVFDADQSLHAWLGPAIGAQAFEVGAEVRDAFLTRDAEHAQAFAARPDSDRFLADLYALARRELSRARPVDVSGGEHCTVTEAALFHSHRRDGVRSGRMATVAWLTVDRGPHDA